MGTLGANAKTALVDVFEDRLTAASKINAAIFVSTIPFSIVLVVDL
jgi:hypothetical protein